MRTIVLRIGWLLTLTLLSSGCGEGVRFPLAPVTGKVTYQGKPLVRGTVVFMPEEGTPGSQAIGNIQPDGTFTMMTANVSGAAIGKHKVTVHSRREHTAEESAQLKIPPSLIPEKYGKEAESGLAFEVQKGSNEYPIDLK
jgi:hypothetical protein